MHTDSRASSWWCAGVDIQYSQHRNYFNNNNTLFLIVFPFNVLCARATVHNVV